MQAETSERNDFKQLIHRFSNAARTYDLHDTMHRDVALRLVEQIEFSGARPKRILDAGCGTGILSQLVHARFPEARLDAVDVAAEMVRVARQKFPPASDWLRCIECDIRDFRSHEPYDLIVSSSALHWIFPHLGVLEHLLTQLQPGGQLLVSIMNAGTLAELHQLRMAIAPDTAPARRLPEHDDWVADLQGMPGIRLRAFRFAHRVPYESAAHMLRVLNQQGVTGGPFSRGPRPLRRQELRRLTERYDALHGDARGGVFGTYDISLFDIRKIVS